VFKKLLVIITPIFFSVYSMAQVPDFSGITRSDAENALEDFTSASYPSIVSGASSMGMLIGVEAGLVGGIVNADNIKELTNNDVDKLPHLGAYVRVDAPFGFGAELTIMPIEIDDYKFNSFSIAGRMNINKFIPVLPISAKAKIRIGNADIEYSGVQQGESLEGDMSNKFTSFDITLSKKLFIVEPYIGLGYIDAEGDFNFKSSAFGGAQDRSYDNLDMSTDHLFLGVNLNLIGFRFGVEYSKLYDADRILAKLGFGFGL